MPVLPCEHLTKDGEVAHRVVRVPEALGCPGALCRSKLAAKINGAQLKVGDVYGDGEDYRHFPPETSSASVADGGQPRPRHGAPHMAAVRQIRSPRCDHRLKPAPASAAGGR